MIRNVVSEIGGIGVYGIISMLIFFAVFIGVIILVVTMKKSHVRHMKEMLLDPEDISETGADNDER
ncbi:MAG: cbb3-type cytochrome c oxidase subunit 3 [Verrucomicrobia bacterium]|nr:cbb3-type cytochrome c oxidase subunit 3 [Verrucomicrobiota bacterium]